MPTITKQYVYKVYDATGTFKADLANVVSEFGYSQDINSAGAQLEIKLANLLTDVEASQVDEFLITETGDMFIDEVGNHLVASAEFAFDNIPLDLGNRVKVFAYYDGQEDGEQVFDGLISGWRSNFNDETITVTVLSYGVQLDNYVLNSDPTGTSIEQIISDKEYTLLAGATNAIAQSFNIPADAIVAALTVKGYQSGGPLCNFEWFLYSGTPPSPGPVVASGVGKVFDSTSTTQTITLTTPQTLNGDYFLEIYNLTSGSAIFLEATNTNPYAGGQVYINPNPNWTSVATDDLVFSVLSSSGGTDLAFVDTDPGTILRRIMDQLASQGGLISYTDDTIELTNSEASYSYKIQTILEGVRKVLEISPDGWYWYVDPGTSLLHYHLTSNDTDHTLILGRHIKSLDVEYTLEDLVNTVYFSGGDTGAGENLFKVGTNPVSATAFGQWLELASDNRVTLDDTAETIITGKLNRDAAPVFRTQVIVPDEVYNIESFKLGEVINFRNCNNLIDTLHFQIVRLSRMPDHVRLDLGTLRPKASAELEDVRRRLNALETIDNPDAPS